MSPRARHCLLGTRRAMLSPVQTPIAAELMMGDPQVSLQRLRLQWQGSRERWVFGYASLIWRPEFDATEHRPALVHGWHRALRMRSRVNRGTPQQPGLVFALLTGGACRGVVYRLRPEHAEEALERLWAREMPTGVYDPRLLPCRTPRGTVQVDPFLRTNYPSIFAAGDVAGRYQFTHAAANMAWYAAVNALFGGFWQFRIDEWVMPWCTFLDPEVARVGLNEQDADEQGIAVEVTRYSLDDLDRAIVDGATRGFVKVLTRPGTDRILGATIVGEHAGELIVEFVTAMKRGLGLNKLLGTIHIYPTFAEANKYAAGQWKRAHAPTRLLGWVERFHRWQRG